MNSAHHPKGRRQPARLIRFVNWVVRPLVRRRGSVFGIHLLVLHTVGAKSGEPRETPLQAFVRPDGWWVAASWNGGARNPAWYHNVLAHPEQVRVATAGEVVPVEVHELSGAEREAAWERIVAIAPNFADYAAGTERVIPVLHLRR